MKLAELYEQAINWPSQRQIVLALAVATGLAIAGFPLSFWKPKWLGRLVGLVGLGLFMIVFVVVHEQTIGEVVHKPTMTETAGELISIKRYKYSWGSRVLATVAATVVVCAGATVMWIGYWRVRYQQRQQAPNHLRAGRKHFAEKNYEAALREFSYAIDAAPDLAEGYCRRGLLYHEMGKAEAALADFDRAVECNPRFPTAYLERAKLRTEIGDCDGALSDFGRLMQIQAHDPEAYLQRGICLVKKGLVTDGIADFHRVLKLTNHSDYAEPAKNYLRQALENGGSPPRLEFNGAPLKLSRAETRAQDPSI